VIGMAEGLIKSAYISHFHTIRGHSPRGSQCSLIEGRRCLRGPIVTIRNSLRHAVTVRHMVTDIDMLEELTYNSTLHLGAINVRSRCAKGVSFSRTSSVPGMWAYLDPSRADDDTVQIPAADRGSEGLVSFFLDAKAQPDQDEGVACFGLPALDPNDCCFTSLPVAAACRARARDQSFIGSRLRGNMTITVDNFTLGVHVEQTGVPVLFSNDMLHFSIGPVQASCSDFQIENVV